jgi:hypothetical protein
MAKKTGLGKGLDALFSDKPLTQAEEEKILKEGEELVQNIKVIEIEPNKEQPRKHFDSESLEDLAKSIKRYGVIQPIIVNKKDNYYMIVAGERRWRASKIAGLTEIPCIVRDNDERKNRIAKDWSERDDVQDEFKNTYGAKSDEMIRRAKHIVVKSAIQDVNEQKKIFRYSNYLRKHNSSYSIEEADKKALEVYKYKNSLESRNQLDRVINDKSAREEIAERAVQNNRSSKSSDLVRKNCLDMIESAVEFNNVQENSELDIFGGE